jgi:hypothetical protein
MRFMVGEILLAVLPSLVSTLTDQFLNRKRDTVDLTDLQQQVTQLAINQQAVSAEAEHARRAVKVLVRYLTVAEKATFLLRGDHLELAEGVAGRPDNDLARVLQEFGTAVEGQVRQRPPKLRSSVPGSSPSGAGEAVGDDRLEQALEHFFDGFDEEIRRARLGHEAGPR